MTSTPPSSPSPPPDSAYVGALWEHPALCVAIFGVQLITDQGQRLYDASGISEELQESLRTAHGHLCTVPCQTPTSRLLLQYWESEAALHETDRAGDVLPASGGAERGRPFAGAAQAVRSGGGWSARCLNGSVPSVIRSPSMVASVGAH